jgi:hypothetical protein
MNKRLIFPTASIVALIALIVSGFTLAGSVHFGAAQNSPNVTTHSGDLVLGGNDVMTVKDEDYMLNGSLRMSGNSKLILDNATWYVAYHFLYTLNDNAQIIIQRGSDFQAGSLLGFHAYDESLVNMTDSNFEGDLDLSNNARFEAFSSTINYGTINAVSIAVGVLIVNSSVGDLSSSTLIS